MNAHDRLSRIGESVFRMHEANYADSDSESRASWTVPSDMGSLYQAYADVCQLLLRGMGIDQELSRKIREHLFDVEAFNATQVGIILTREYGFEWSPVEGCEECEAFNTPCTECVMYGEVSVLRAAPEEEEEESAYEEVSLSDLGLDDIWRDEDRVAAGKVQ